MCQIKFSYYKIFVLKNHRLIKLDFLSINVSRETIKSLVLDFEI